VRLQAKQSGAQILRETCQTAVDPLREQNVTNPAHETERDESRTEPRVARASAVANKTCPENPEVENAAQQVRAITAPASAGRDRMKRDCKKRLTLRGEEQSVADSNKDGNADETGRDAESIFEKLFVGITRGGTNRDGGSTAVAGRSRVEERGRGARRAAADFDDKRELGRTAIVSVRLGLILAVR
jgi:hypothetical protein